jgi:hypothetical protein
VTVAVQLIDEATATEDGGPQDTVVVDGFAAEAVLKLKRRNDDMRKAADNASRTMVMTAYLLS